MASDCPKCEGGVMPDDISPAAFERLKAHLAILECELAIDDGGGYVLLNANDKRVMLEIPDLAEFAKANGISPQSP